MCEYLPLCFLANSHFRTPIIDALLCDAFGRLAFRIEYGDSQDYDAIKALGF